MALTDAPMPRSKHYQRLSTGLRQRALRAGLSRTARRITAAVVVLLPLTVFMLALTLTRTWTVALAVALAVAPLPWAWVNARTRSRAAQLRKAWPDVADSLLSAVRAGVNLPDAIVQLSTSGPDATRPFFLIFAREFRTTGRFDDALIVVQEEIVDTTADRLFEALRLAREVGGTELGNLLRDLSIVMREDARVRGEILARQSWTINAARLAVAAPWIVLLLISTRTDAAEAYLTATGTGVLAVGGVACTGAYWLMRRIGASGFDCEYRAGRNR